MHGGVVMKKLTGLILLLTMTLGLFTAFPSPTNASNFGITCLDPNKAVSTILSGSKKNSVKYNVVKSKMTLYIDGKSKLNIDCEFADVWLYHVNSTTTLISVFYFNKNDICVDKIYRYDGSKLVYLDDIGYILTSNTGFTQIYPEDAGNNEFFCWCVREEPSLGIYSIDAKFKYNTSSKKISKATNTYNVFLEGIDGAKPGKKGGWQDNWGTASKSFKTYTKAGGSTLSFSVNKGDRLRVQQVDIQTKAVYFQVKNKQGKIGWYKDPKKWSENNVYFFMEAMTLDDM